MDIDRHVARKGIGFEKIYIQRRRHVGEYSLNHRSDLKKTDNQTLEVLASLFQSAERSSIPIDRQDDEKARAITWPASNQQRLRCDNAVFVARRIDHPLPRAVVVEQIVPVQFGIERLLGGVVDRKILILLRRDRQAAVRGGVADVVVGDAVLPGREFVSRAFVAADAANPAHAKDVGLTL